MSAHLQPDPANGWRGGVCRSFADGDKVAEHPSAAAHSASAGSLGTSNCEASLGRKAKHAKHQ
eukprot:12930662-Prorocentrum_lima.AAC.1